MVFGQAFANGSRAKRANEMKLRSRQHIAFEPSTGAPRKMRRKRNEEMSKWETKGPKRRRDDRDENRGETTNKRGERKGGGTGKKQKNDKTKMQSVKLSMRKCALSNRFVRASSAHLHIE